MEIKGERGIYMEREGDVGQRGIYRKRYGEREGQRRQIGIDSNKEGYIGKYTDIELEIGGYNQLY